MPVCKNTDRHQFTYKIIFIQFCWDLVQIVQCLNKVFISHCVLMLPIDNSFERLEIEILGLVQNFVMLFIYFYISKSIISLE